MSTVVARPWEACRHRPSPWICRSHSACPLLPSAARGRLPLPSSRSRGWPPLPVSVNPSQPLIVSSSIFRDVYTLCLLSVWKFAGCILSDTRQTTTLLSAEHKTLVKRETLGKVLFAECLKFNTRQLPGLPSARHKILGKQEKPDFSPFCYFDFSFWSSVKTCN
jgi:hypothetical protein